MDKPEENVEKVCVSRQLFNIVITLIIAAFTSAMVVQQAQMSNLRLEVRTVQLEQKKYTIDKAEELKYLIEIRQTVGDLDNQVIEYKKQEKP